MGNVFSFTEISLFEGVVVMKRCAANEGFSGFSKPDSAVPKMKLSEIPHLKCRGAAKGKDDAKKKAKR